MQGPSRGFREIHRDENLSNGFRVSPATAMQLVQSVLYEISANHKTFCTQWGVEEKELEESLEFTETTAYDVYLTDVEFQGDATNLNMAIVVCPLGHGEVGPWLADESKRPNRWAIMDGLSSSYVPQIRVLRRDVSKSGWDRPRCTANIFAWVVPKHG